MNIRLLPLFLLLCSNLLWSQEQYNLSLISNIVLPEKTNDVWGYVGPDGTEYAVVGAAEATYFFSLADPSNPQQIKKIDGPFSKTRDIKSWKNYLYILTNGGNEGMLIVDMSGAPDNITSFTLRPEAIINGQSYFIWSCRHIFIDENGIAYLSDCGNLNLGDVLMFDLASDPEAPSFVGLSKYGQASRDCFVRGDTLWNAHTEYGRFSIQDLSDKSDPIVLQDKSTLYHSPYNLYPSDDGKYLFSADEHQYARVEAYDVSKLEDIKVLDVYQPHYPDQSNSIPHSPVYKDGFLVTSWYTEGLFVIDASRPDNLIEVAAYPTYKGDKQMVLSGCFGVYPFLPSGLILATDTEEGLFVFDPQYKRAAYMEGVVSDAVSGALLEDVRVELIDLPKTIAATDTSGVYKTGYALEGVYQALFAYPGYITQVVEVSLKNGKVHILDIQLERDTPASLQIILVDAVTAAPIPGGQIFLDNRVDQFQFSADAAGSIFIDNLGASAFDLVVGAWGYQLYQGYYDWQANIQLLEIPLQQGHQDDFFFDFGWEETNTGTLRGHWTRVIPLPTSSSNGFVNVNKDKLDDYGEQCFLTGQGGIDPDFGDVEKASVILTSPKIALQNYTNPVISYFTWFVNEGGDSPANDSLIVRLHDGQEEKIVEVITSSAGAWRPRSEIQISDFFSNAEEIYIQFTTMDQEETPHLVEAGVDVFRVTEGFPVVGTQSPFLVDLSFRVYPNPSSDRFILEYTLDKVKENAMVSVFNITGQEIYQQKVLPGHNTLELGSEFTPGIYFVQFTVNGVRSKIRKMVKQ